jgi:cytochrome c-type biogenesis protein
MIEAELAYAFTAGMIAAVNPCGFALLPAYLSYFLGLEGASDDATAGVSRAVAVGLVVTAGFVLVFGVMGLLITQLSLTIHRQLPWVTMAVGVGIVVLGLAMLLRGYQLTLRLPKVRTGSIGSELSSMFVFGVSYAVASLSCTLPVFLPLMTRTFRSANFVSGITVFLVYAAGMGVLLCAITLALASARGALVARLRQAQPYISRVSGALLVVAGTYLVYYGWWERGVYADPRNPPPSGPVNAVTNLSGRVSDWINQFGGLRLGLILGLMVAAAVVGTVVRRRSETPRDTPSEPRPV